MGYLLKVDCLQLYQGGDRQGGGETVTAHAGLGTKRVPVPRWLSLWDVVLGTVTHGHTRELPLSAASPAEDRAVPSLCLYQDQMEPLNQEMPLLPPPCNFHYQ